jgi:segregation and condensation protein B
MTLRAEYVDVPDVLRGPARERRLNLSAIETLSIVAYRGPVTAEAVNQLRGKPSTSVLAQLVRRGLVRLERPGRGQPARYSVTARFLEIAGLESLEDLPRAQDLDAK